ncbi:MAG TPA: NAD-dependent epimerase/dehydratase family protein [Candidatus Dormibacteraeota bacterium]|nr:NAD-dependent epimerase/dehydratase family protein [Candidatus Dormibacteraeota bacterium]
MHLVIGAGEFLGDIVSRTLATEVPVIELGADADEETLRDAMGGVEIVHICAQAWSPARRLRFRKGPPPVLPRIVEAARHAGVRRLVLVSTADVYGPDHNTRITEKTKPHPVHVFEKLKLLEEQWLRSEADDLEVVVLRPARVFGVGEDWLLPKLLVDLSRGRVWLPLGGRAEQTFIAGSDVARACLAAADRGEPGRSYIVGGFDSTWRAALESICRAIDLECVVSSVPYDLAYLRALGEEMFTPVGAPVWPGIYAVDVLSKPRFYDDSHSRRELTWSPSIGSFEQDLARMKPWLSGLVREAKSAVVQRA